VLLIGKPNVEQTISVYLLLTLLLVHFFSTTHCVLWALDNLLAKPMKTTYSDNVLWVAGV